MRHVPRRRSVGASPVRRPRRGEPAGGPSSSPFPAAPLSPPPGVREGAANRRRPRGGRGLDAVPPAEAPAGASPTNGAAGRGGGRRSGRPSPGGRRPHAPPCADGHRAAVGGPAGRPSAERSLGRRTGSAAEGRSVCPRARGRRDKARRMALSLKVGVVEKNVVKTIQFEPTTLVYDACRIVRDKITEANLGQPKDYGLFLADEDPRKGVWLEPGRQLEYYLLRTGDLLEYRRKIRPLRVRMLDGTVKTVLVDDSQPVANLMVVVCTKIGITNHDEFSLVRDLPEEIKENSTGTLTLKKEKKDKERDQKMEQLKKKLKTDDDLDWVDHSMTLREQGINEEETLLLRRKFFFSDQNVDSRDPVQLNLLYVQARDAILNETHPVTVDQACQFAGIQCQIQFGDHVESKHKPGFLDLKEFLPKNFCKMKGIEKKVFSEHKNYAGLAELDAKVKYVSLARSLKTYGVTFFLVKEKMKGKNKLVPRLLGVTKDSVLRLDERTKEIMKTWPLTTVRRWAASPNSFTLDFGDYSDSYYSVQTTEGEQISQLIAGYIDIILKKKKAKDRFGIEGDEGSTMVEDSVSPAKATILQNTPAAKPSHPTSGSIALPAVMRPGANGAQPYTAGQMQGAQFGEIKGQAHTAYSPKTPQHPRVHSAMSEPQRALLSTIGAGREAIDSAQKELQSRIQLPDLGTDPASLQWKQNTMDVKKQNVSSQVAAMNAATAQVITLTSGPPEEVDHPAVGAAISTIATNLTEMSKDVKMIAALMDDDLTGDKLIDATRNLCSAFSDLLKAAEPESKEPRQNLLNAASRVGEASHAVLYTIGEEDGIDKEAQDILLGLAKRVANSTANLVLKAKNVASKCDDQAIQNKVINAATQCALATSQLVACAKVVAPTINNPNCRQQLIEATKEVAKAVDGILKACQEATDDEKLLRDSATAVTQVNEALSDLLNHVRTFPEKGARTSAHDGAVDTILDATDRLFSSTGDATEMVRQAKILAKATSHLIGSIKGEAETQPDSDVQKRLLAAAKLLADATSKMVEAAKGCASNPHDSESQAALRRAAEELRSATNAAASNALKRKLIHRLENAAKHAAAMATQNIAAAQGVRPHNNNQVTQGELMDSCREVAEVIPHVVQGVKGTMADIDNPNAQMTLINACEQMIQPCNKMITSSKAALPTVADQSSSMQLSNALRQMAAALAELRSAIIKAQEACGTLEINSALEQIHDLNEELLAIKKAALSSNLKPLPGESIETSSLQLGAISKVVGSAMAQLLTAASQANENYTGIAARDTANALKILTSAVRGVAATCSDLPTQTRIIDSAREVMDKSAHLVEEARRAVHNPTDVSNQQRLAQVAKLVSNALNNCVNCLPGQKDVDDAIKSITEASHALNAQQFPLSNKTYSELQNNLTSAAANLNEAASNVVVSSKDTPANLSNSAKKFGTAFEDLLGCGMEIIGQTKDTEVRGQMVVSLKNVSMVSSKLLVTAKSVAADPTAPNSKTQLASAARAVTESINHLVNVCTSAAPGQKECDNAIRNIQMMRPLLDNPSEAVNDATYFECLDNVMEKSKSLGDGMTGIANHAKQGAREKFGEAVKDVSDAICGLIESAAQAAYLVGVSDPSSVTGRPGLVDPVHFARASQAIQMACQQLINPTSNQQQILSAATVIAKHTSSLCNSCRLASSKTTNPVAKRQFVQSAKDVANATANLVKEIKILDQEPTEIHRQNTAYATAPLIEAVENLTTFASSPEFASAPAKISSKARASQEPITSAGKSIIDGSCNMIQAAKSLAVNPKDPPAWQTLANHSRSVSDAIKTLVSSIRDKAPGQKECEQAIERLSACIRELDRASVSIISQSLQPRTDNTLKGFQEQMENSASEILDKIDIIGSAGKGEAEKLGHSVTNMVGYFDPLVKSAIGSASKTLNSKQQMAILDQTKTVAECALQLVYTAKESGGNPKATHLHGEIDESADAMKDALQDLLHTLEVATTETGVITGVIESINKSVSKMDDYQVSSSQDSFVDYQTRMVNSAKEIARIAQEMITKSTTDVAQLGPLTARMSHEFANLASDARGAISATPNVDVAGRIRSSVQDLGNACIHLTKSASSCQSNPGDSFSQHDIADNSRLVAEKVSFVLAALQAGSRGTQACISAVSTVNGIIGDLETTIMFATAGTLHAEHETETFADHRENILKTARTLVEDTKTLVTGAASSQEQLAVAAQNAVATIIQLAEVVKMGAASLGSNNPEAQVLLINAVKDVATALGDLIQSTKVASGKSIHDPSMLYLKESAKVMVTNVTSLLKTVKSVEDEHSRGTRALESTIEAIGQEIRAFDSSEPPSRKALPEDLVRATKPVTLATGKAVAAGNSCKQDDIIVAANMGRKAIVDLLTTCKAAAYSAETIHTRTKIMDAGHQCAIHYRELLQMVHQVIQKPSQTGRQQLVIMSRTIATSITEVANGAEMLKGSDWVDPDDPTVIAETELLGAANSIDAAAKKLASLKPRRSIRETDESMNFDEMILEAAKSIAAATSALVKAASAAQRELVAAGKVGAHPLYTSDDGQWSEGLVSAARLVAAATHSLVEAANSLVQGHASEEKLISSAKQVASSTAQLLVACKVKADPDSQSTKRLQAAGNAVKRATDNLVKAAQQAIEHDEERSLIINKRMVGGIAQEIVAREEILKKERELEEARERLAAIRRAKYGNRPADDYHGYGSS
ncbi:talin-2-like isoform X2 [Centruroides sculpturatus]|uniref:talin-2-like isoform X2 n=1 Tax=Centruroides sculpturatus TaxID=218467 RepID=UPI000C6DC9FB|nr:talin-2-like isoform X2 [Centruroides sculpturatus]